MTSPSTDRRFSSNSSLAIKAPVKAATTANITLSGEQTIDGVSIVTGDRVLVKDQTTGSQNGIYIADTSSWERSPDFDGSRDVVQGTQVYVNTGGTANGGGTFVVTTSGSIVPGTTSIAFNRTSAGSVIPTYNVATAGQTALTVATYQPGSNSIDVFVNGLRQRVDADYTETSSTVITFTYPLQAGDEVDTYSTVPSATLTAASATAVSVADAGDFYVGTTAEAVLQEIAGGIAEDNGDADVTFTNASSSRIQRWDTTLTANRTLTLSTSNAKEGAWVLAVRGSGATGNFTLSIGSLATLRAPGEWAKCVYDAGTSAWVLVGYGILPSAEVLAMSADKGDANATLTVGTSERTSRWATTLTEDRTATLSTTGAWNGARLSIVRTEAATGNFNLNVVVGSTRLLRLAPGQWCTVEYSGTTWIVTGFGNARPGLSTVIELRDDFLGEEIDGYKWQSLIGTDAECRQAVVLSDQIGGVVRLTTGDDAAASMAVNGTQLQSRLNWKAEQGGLVCEFRLAIDTITTVCVFLGLTDQVSALEMPFTLSGTTLTSNASNAVGVLFDTDATTDDWWLVGVAADVDATKQDSAVAPTAGTFETWRIELSATGAATFYRNGSVIGSAMTGAVTASAGLTPVVAAFSRTTSSRNIDVDEVLVQAQR
jgi:hypothetical protein